MPSASALYASNKWLNAADIVAKVGMGKRITAVVQHAEPALLGMGADQRERVVLSLVSRQGNPWPKQLPLNQTRNMAMVSAYGDDYSQWPGKPIEIWAENVLFNGKPTPSIKIAATANGNGQIQANPVQQQAQPQNPPPSATAVAGMPPIAGSAPVTTAALIDDDIPF